MAQQSLDNSASSALPSAAKNPISDLQDTTIPQDEKNTQSSNTERNEDTEIESPQYVTGLALYTVVGGLTMAVFVLMLDSTIVTTVS